MLNMDFHAEANSQTN